MKIRFPRIAASQARIATVFGQRCFYLFISLIALIVAAPYAPDFEHGRHLINLAQVLVLVAAVAAVGRSVTPFVIALLLGIPALGLQLMVIEGIDDPSHLAFWATAFFLAFYVVAIIYLLRYVFTADVMTADKLFGAAAGYLMLGIAWTYAYVLAQRLDPAVFVANPDGTPRAFYDLLHMSFGLLTSNGPGDVVATGIKVRMLSIIEQITGTLFVAILVARLAGIYPQREPKDEPEEKEEK